MPVPKTIYLCEEHKAYYTNRADLKKHMDVVHRDGHDGVGHEILCRCTPVDAKTWLEARRRGDRHRQQVTGNTRQQALQARNAFVVERVPQSDPR